MIRLPANGKWVQANGSDRRGNLAQTRNITLDKEGYVTLSHSSRVAMNESVDADFDEPAVIVRDQDYGYFVETHDSAFEMNENKLLGVRPTQIADVGVPSGDLQSDAVYSGQLLIVTQDTDVDYYDPSAETWTDTDITLTATSGSQHPIENFLALSAFAIGNVNTVLLYSSPPDATPTLLATLTILSDFYITSLAYFNQNLYVGTMNRYGGKAFMYVWNGYGTAAQSAYEVDSNIIFDVCVHQDAVVCFTGAGQILRYNGSGFTPLDNLPIFYSTQSMADEVNVSMFHNCLKSNGDLLYINVSTDAIVNKPLSQPDGIWCYDSKLGFAYHRYSLSGALVDIDTIPTTDVNTTTGQITVTAASITGTEVIYDNAGSTTLTPLVAQKKYFTIKVDATHVKLATTKANALAGTSITLTGTGNSSQFLVFFPNTDFGQSLNKRVGTIFPILREVTFPMYGTDLIWGGLVNKRTSVDDTGTLGTVTNAVENRGYFITSWLTTENVSDAFTNLIIKFSKFKSELDKIVVKYRFEDDRKETIVVSGATRWVATWTSTTTFTTTETEFETAVEGDEVEFLRGAGAGITAHISAISVNAGTYTVTIDETHDYYESGDTCIFIFRNWTKLGLISTTSTTNGVLDSEVGYKKFDFGNRVNGKQIQLKFELRGINTQIEELLVNNVSFIPANK